MISHITHLSLRNHKNVWLDLWHQNYFPPSLPAGVHIILALQFWCMLFIYTCLCHICLILVAMCNDVGTTGLRSYIVIVFFWLCLPLAGDCSLCCMEEIAYTSVAMCTRKGFFTENISGIVSFLARTWRRLAAVGWQIHFLKMGICWRAIKFSFCLSGIRRGHLWVR